jgi:hypothetical protein
VEVREVEAREGAAAEAADAAAVAAVARIRPMKKRNRKKVILRVSIFIYFKCAVKSF